MRLLSGLFSKKEKKEDIIKNNRIAAENGDIKLIILTESKNKYLQQFFVTKGIYPEEVCYTIEDASTRLIREKCSVRLVIIDQGLGDLYNIATREDLQMVLSMCDGVYKKALVFYSKYGAYYDNRNLGSDVVRWELYDGLDNVARTINGLGETYSVTQAVADKFILDPIPPLQTKGVKVEKTDKFKYAESNVDVYALLNNLYEECLEANGESLPQY